MFTGDIGQNSVLFTKNLSWSVNHPAMAEIWILIENCSYTLPSCMDTMIYIYVTIIRFDHIDDSAGPYIKYIEKGINNASK